jgi:hypothetical protein
MKRTWVLLAAILISMAPITAFGQSVDDERAGIDRQAGSSTANPDPAARQRAIQLRGASGLLLVPDSTDDRVMAFDPMTGNLVDADFIPADATNLSTPIQAIQGFTPDQILISDQIEDVVLEYDALTGAFVGVFAPAGGVNTNLLDNIRGIAISSGGSLLVSVGGGANDDAIAEFDSSGNYLGNFVANGAGGLDSPFDVIERAGGDFLVPGITSDAIHRYDASGSPLANLTAINNFPEQISETPSGNLLVGNFSGTEEGVVEYTSAGALVGIYDPAALGGYRGVYELPNGNILTTNDGGVHEIDRNGNLIETKISGVNARFISFLPPDGPACGPMTLSVTVGGDIVANGTPGCVFDLYDANCSSNPNDWTLLASGLVLDGNGQLVIPGVVGQPSTCYITTVAGDPNQPLSPLIQTIPTLGETMMIIFAALLLIAGLATMRRFRSREV